MARFRDKPGLDWAEVGVCDETCSTEGAWCYFAWIDDPDREVEEVLRHEAVDEGRGLGYEPEVHVVEVASHAVEVPVAIVKMCEVVDSFAERVSKEVKGGYVGRLSARNVLEAFLDDLKRMLLQAFAMDSSDPAGALYFQRSFAESGGELRLVSLFDEEVAR
ncbi:hypothetical protein HYW67_00860 [Candidatus Parcubacteria bacterium]|nr:hypothetical protein [Candidatus Parcubacteria bacterium]